jgi:hypothetical protein
LAIYDEEIVMVREPMIFSFVLSLLALSASAGALKDGIWLPSNCGIRPIPPVIDTTSLDNYNASVTAVNEWQKTVKDFDTCLVKEANTDAALVSDTAKSEQATLKQIAEEIKNKLEVGRQELQQSRGGIM